MCQLALGGSGEVEIRPGYAPLINHDWVVDLIAEEAKAMMGPESIIWREKASMGVEDFSFFVQERPGSFYHLGCGNPGKGHWRSAPLQRLRYRRGLPAHRRRHAGGRRAQAPRSAAMRAAVLWRGGPGRARGRPSPAKKPRRLRPGARVSLIAPSGSAKRPRQGRSLHPGPLKAFGLRVKASPHCSDAYGYLAGDDATRARELELAFLDPDTTGVLCLKGGYGAPRILDKIDYGVIAANPKLFLGYSDITALHIAFRQMAGLVTFHGPMPSSDMVPDFDPESRTSLEGHCCSEGAALPGKIANPHEPPL